MSTWYIGTSDSESLAHFGILGMKWGVRRYQNSDGTLTPAGQERYSKLADKYKTKADKYRMRNTVTGDKDMLRKAKYETKKAKYERKYYNTQNDKYLLKASKYGKKAADIEQRYAKSNLKASKYDKKRAAAEELLNRKPSDEAYNKYKKRLDNDKAYQKDLKSHGYISDTRYKNYLSDLVSYMHEDMEYDASKHKLRSPKDTLIYGKGNCHDQTLLELDVLERMGYNPKAKFIMEVDPSTNKGGTTHSYVYCKDGNKYIWFENAWDDEAGIKSYKTESDLNKDVMKKFKANSSMGEVLSGDFRALPGDTLQDIVNKSLR